MVLDSRCRSAGFSGSDCLTRLQSRCCPGLQSSPSLTVGGAASRLTHMAVDELQKFHFEAHHIVLTGCRPLLETGQKRVPCSVGLSMGYLTHGNWLSPEQERERAKESEQNGKQSFCNLILKVTSQHFCHFLFVGSESLSSTYTQRESIIEGHEYLESEILKGYFRSCLTYFLKPNADVHDF